MRKVNIDAELRQWAATVLNEILITGFDCDTITSKLMECGIMVESGILPVPRYWPNPKQSIIHNKIIELPLLERNYIVGKRILGNSYMELATMSGLSKTGAYKKMDEIEQKLAKELALVNEFF